MPDKVQVLRCDDFIKNVPEVYILVEVVPHVYGLDVESVADLVILFLVKLSDCLGDQIVFRFKGTNA